MIHFLCNFKLKSILCALLICISLTSGCDFGSSKSNSDKMALTVVDFNWKIDDNGNRFIAGTLKNNSSNEYAYVEVEFNLFDDRGKQVGSTFTNMNDLMPNGTWNFEAIVMEGEAKEAKLKDVTGS